MIMVRNIHVGMRFDYEEYKEIEERAEKEHLNIGTYIRHYLFNNKGFFQPLISEPVRSGIPKRLVSSEIVHAIKRQDKMGEVLKEMEELFKKGLRLEPVTEEMKLEVYKNRKLKELHPPR